MSPPSIGLIAGPLSPRILDAQVLAASLLSLAHRPICVAAVVSSVPQVLVRGEPIGSRPSRTLATDTPFQRPPVFKLPAPPSRLPPRLTGEFVTSNSTCPHVTVLFLLLLGPNVSAATLGDAAEYCPHKETAE